MGKTVEIRGVRIGEGVPKIIVPVTGRTCQEIIADAQRIAACGPDSAPDLVEWRADWYENTTDFLSAAQALRDTLGEVPLLFTFRTAAEGGQRELSSAEYSELCIQMAESGLIDLLDVELSAGEDVFGKILDAAHACGVKVIASSHDFDKTPSEEEILSRLRKMQDLGADICKIAVMPQNPGDVLTLLSATWKMKAHYADRPLITMSMSGQGLISRLCGETFGSAATFGTIGRASAPGQIETGKLKAVLEVLKQK